MSHDKFSFFISVLITAWTGYWQTSQKNVEVFLNVVKPLAV